MKGSDVVTSKLHDPRFRSERARRAAQASNTGQGVVTRLLHALDTLSDEQRATIRRALDRRVK